MQPYQYTQLAYQDVDIRLLTLLPGNFDDDLKITVSHVPLVKRRDIPLPGISLEELRRTLPPGWQVEETLEGRYAFVNVSMRAISWQHPSPGIPPERYELRRSNACFEPRYEALTYTWGIGECPRS